ncbi:MAG: DUF488 domain-containing protein [candidate division WOR-3 bacterium]
MVKEIFTIGHSNRKIDEFIDILLFYKIKNLIDIRRFPSSEKFFWFNKENLEKELKKHNILYFWLGEELGGFRRRGYENYMNTQNYKLGIEKLIDISRERSCIMCAEKLFFRCHRKFLSKTLKELNYKVIHIMDKNKFFEFK